jgi:hypothetical protein
MSQPIPAATITTIAVPALIEDNTWTTGDSFVVYTRPAVNLKGWRPSGGDATITGGGAWVQWVSVSDSSGTGDSFYSMISETLAVYSGVQFLGRVHSSTLAGRNVQNAIIGCDIRGQLAAWTVNPTVFAGYVFGGLSSAWAGGFGGDAMLHGGAVTIQGQHVEFGFSSAPTQGGAWTDSSVEIDVGASIHATASGAGLWGPGTLEISPMGAYWNLSGTTFATSLQLSGGLTFGSHNTGTKYVSGTWTDGVSLTTANMDLFGGLQDPLTGARFCLQQ